MTNETVPYVKLDELQQGMSSTPETTKFLITCLKEGSLENVPKHSSLTRWLRGLDITFTYFLTPLTCNDLGQQHGVTHQAIDETIKKTIDQLWLNSSEATQLLFDKDSLSSHKDMTIARLISPFENIDIDKILEKGDFNHKINRLRQHNGLIIPPKEKSKCKSAQIADDIVKATTDEEVDRALSKTSKRFCLEHSKGENPVVISLASLTNIDQRGRRQEEVDKFIQTLIMSHIPVRIFIQEIMSGKQKGNVHRYFYVAAQDKEKAIQSFVMRGLIQDGQF